MSEVVISREMNYPTLLSLFSGRLSFRMGSVYYWVDGFGLGTKITPKEEFESTSFLCKRSNRGIRETTSTFFWRAPNKNGELGSKRAHRNKMKYWNNRSLQQSNKLVKQLFLPTTPRKNKKKSNNSYMYSTKKLT